MSLRVGSLQTIWRAGALSQIALATTLVATLLLPVAAAVGIGVAISLLLQLRQEAIDLSVVQLVRLDDGRFEERPAPAHPASRSVTLLDVYGSLYYAGARTLEARLPDPAGSARSVVVVRLRGRTALGATAFVVLARYAQRLEAAGGRLYLSGVDPHLLEQLRRTRRVDVDRRVRVFPAGEIVGEASARAYRQGEHWLARQGG
jgi:sulfate permease, SulP family